MNTQLISIKSWLVVGGLACEDWRMSVLAARRTWVAMSCLVLLAGSIHAQQYVEISGVIEWEHFDSEHTNEEAVIKDNPVHFTCIVGTNVWRIDNVFCVNGETRWFYDGTNVFDSTRITKPAPPGFNELLTKKFGPEPLPFDVARSNISVNISTVSGGHPFGNEGVNVPWLAFCSGAYLKLPARIVPPPCSDLPNSLDAYAYSDKTTTFDDDFGLPNVLDLYTSDKLHEASVNAYFYRTRGEAAKPRKGFGDGFLKFHYETTQSTNFMGWNFPVAFSFFQNDWFNGNWFLRFRGAGKIQTMRRAEKPQGLLLPNTPNTVVDYRLWSGEKFVDGIVYQTTNTSAAPTNSPEIQAVYQAKLAEAPPRLIKPNH